ncbi:MAG TPA: hypothetical protein VGI56_04550 [Galbitalea sp.]
MSIRLQPAALQPGGLSPIAVLDPDPGRTEWADLGWPGLDPSRPCLDIFDFDHSGSVNSSGGTDPIGNRFREVEHALEAVAAWCVSARPKAAIIHFDQPSVGNTPVVPLHSNRSLRSLKVALRVPSDALGSSDLGPSLDEAERIAAAHPDHDVRFTILSDFELTDLDSSAVFARLAGFPGKIHAVVLNAEPPNDLSGENITITRVQYEDPPGALAAAIHRSLTATRRGRRLSAVHADRTRPSIPPLSPGFETARGSRS